MTEGAGGGAGLSNVGRPCYLCTLDSGHHDGLKPHRSSPLDGPSVLRSRPAGSECVDRPVGSPVGSDWVSPESITMGGGCKALIG